MSLFPGKPLSGWRRGAQFHGDHTRSRKVFGEMSLLTGEPRSATVLAATELLVIAVGKQALLQVVQEDRRLIERIGEVVAHRQAATAAAKAQLSRDAAALSAVTHTRSLIERIQNFFWGARKAQ